MSLFRIQTAIDKLLVIFLYITHVCSLQQVVAGIHLNTDRIQGLDNLRYVRYNGILTVGKLGKEMVFDN